MVNLAPIVVVTFAVTTDMLYLAYRRRLQVDADAASGCMRAGR